MLQPLVWRTAVLVTGGANCRWVVNKEPKSARCVISDGGSDTQGQWAVVVAAVASLVGLAVLRPKLLTLW